MRAVPLLLMLPLATLAPIACHDRAAEVSHGQAQQPGPGRGQTNPPPQNPLEPETILLRARVKALEEMLQERDEAEKLRLAQQPAARRFTFTNRNAEPFPAAGLVVFASDPATGSFGWAALSICPAAAGQLVKGRLGQGAVAVLGAPRLELLDQGLGLLAGGKAPADVVKALCPDPGKSKLLQLAAFAPDGAGATFLGSFAPARQGEARGPRCLALGCELAIETLPEAACAAVGKAGDKPLPERLLDALVEARVAPARIPQGRPGASLSPEGRPMLSAALVVLREGGSLDGTTDRLVDLRIDYDVEPIGALQTLYDTWVRASVLPRLKAYLKAAKDPQSAAASADRAWLDRLRAGEAGK